MTFINGPLPKKSAEAKRAASLAKRVPKRIREMQKPSEGVVLYRAEGPNLPRENHAQG